MVHAISLRVKAHHPDAVNCRSIVADCQIVVAFCKMVKRQNHVRLCHRHAELSELRGNRISSDHCELLAKTGHITAVEDSRCGEHGVKYHSFVLTLVLIVMQPIEEVASGKDAVRRIIDMREVEVEKICREPWVHGIWVDLPIVVHVALLLSVGRARSHFGRHSIYALHTISWRTDNVLCSMYG